MKKFYKKTILIYIFSFFMFATAKAQALEDVVTYLRNGNVGLLAKSFDNIVTITVSSNQSAYSKTQAEMVLKDFFGKNIVKDFVVMQSGTAPNNNSKYAIGKLTTTNGNFQLYVLMKLKDGAYLVQELRFEK
jgi:hypothetical protein